MTALGAPPQPEGSPSSFRRLGEPLTVPAGGSAGRPMSLASVE